MAAMRMRWLGIYKDDWMKDKPRFAQEVADMREWPLSQFRSQDWKVQH